MRKGTVLLFLIVVFFPPAANSFADSVSLQGEIRTISRRAGIFLLSAGTGIEPVEYGDTTKFLNIKDDLDIYEGMTVEVKADDSGFLLFAEEVRGPEPLRIVNGKYIALEEFTTSRKSAEVYDLRSLDAYRRGHVPGSLPVARVNEDMKELLFYCEDRYCSNIGRYINIIRDAKIKKAFFRGGIKEWTESDLPLEISIDMLDDIRDAGTPYIFVDIRSGDEIEAGFIPGAVSIPDDIITYTNYRFPQYKKALIVIYGKDGNDERVFRSAKVVKTWGYKNVYMLEGGIEMYKKKGRRLVKEGIKEEITYIKRYREYEVARSKFMELLEELPGNVVILDVREREEAEKGRFRNSVNIPLDELQYRIDELDRSKYIVTHCTSGVRATIGYYILKKAGINAGCLNASVGFDDSGVSTISDN